MFICKDCDTVDDALPIHQRRWMVDEKGVIHPTQLS
jgi:hypothetical protein